MNIIFEAGAWLYKMIIVFVCAFVVISIVGSSMKPELNTIELQRSTMRAAILYSPDGLAYQDENNVVHPGIVDKQRFETISQRLTYPKSYGGAQLRIRLEGEDSWLSETYVAKENFDTLYPPIAAGVGKSGSIETHTYPVQLKVDGALSNAYLTVTIVMPYKTQ